MGIRSELDVVIHPLYPYTIEEVDPITGKKLYQGATFSQFSNVTQSLNISLNLILNPSRFWGSRLPNGSYTGMQRMAYEGEVDIALGPFFRSGVTALEMEPGFPTLFTRFGFISGYRSLYTIELAEAPFNTEVSACILALCICVPLLFYIAQKGNPRRMTLFDCFYLSSSVFLQDPIDTRRFVSNPSRITLVSWSFCTYIIVQVVAGILRSKTAVKTPVQMIDTFKQVLDDPTLEPTTWEDTPTMTVLQEIRGEPLRRLRERMNRMKSVVPLTEFVGDATINKILDGKAVFIHEPDMMLIAFSPMCDRFTGYFHINENDYIQAEGVWYYAPKLDRATRRAISERTLWTFESAVPFMRERELLPVPPKCFTFAIRSNALGGTEDSQSFSMVHLLPFFYGWMMGLGAGGVALIGELLKEWISRHRVEKHSNTRYASRDAAKF